MEVGREEVRKGLALLERIAVAQEKLNELATEERIEDANLPDPGFCPHCSKLSPRIRNEGAEGEMAEFVLVASCLNCGKTFYALPRGWQVCSTPDEVRTAMEGRNV